MAALLDINTTSALVPEAAGPAPAACGGPFAATATPPLVLTVMRLHPTRAGIKAGRVGRNGLNGLAMRRGFSHMGQFALDHWQQLRIPPSWPARDHRRLVLFQE
ncbi:hypothetical protein RAH32_16890 [Paracoccus sp. WLY502]|uniref:hypothetical protein n=1 Tax=Paracoccus yibinensis TaxID=3068891 RepID=UPI002796D908|nr:hypothetical protein [Paracoccus sp. WLY502]MDQ1902108.1 hypothetical protein [Paracoccus sp. WLY502]